jgi:hypothetical protein
MRRKVTALTGIVLLVAGTAFAQPAPRADGQIGFEKKVDLTPEQELSEVERDVDEMRGMSATVQRMLGRAREERDALKVLCVDDNLSQIDVALRTAIDRRERLRGAVSRRDPEGAAHEYTMISILHRRARELMTAANACLGQTHAPGEPDTTVRWWTDPTIPEEDPSYPPTDPTLVSAPPQCVSCAQ